MTPALDTTRRHYIDWLRIIAVLLLFPFHISRIFNVGDEFYAKSDTLSHGLTWVVAYLDHWHMPLFIFLAGASTWFALSHRSGGQYAWERVKRLLVPFAFGLIVLIPPQSYLGALSHGTTNASFFGWFPNFFHLSTVDPGAYYSGGLTFGHLWFIFHLFMYALIALPIFLVLRRGIGRRFTGLLARATAKPGVILALGLLTFPAMFVGDFAGGNPVWLGIPFLLGYVMMSDARFEQAIDRHKLAALILGPLAALAVTYFDVNGGPGLTGVAGWLYDLYSGVLIPWFCIVPFLGYGRRFLNRGGAVQRYAATASYPVYLLHQTLIVAVGVAVLKAGMGVPLSFAAILAGSFAGTMVAYELLRRVKVIRFLMGIRWAPGRRPASAQPEVARQAPATTSGGRA
jgi:peptidoglycan/LPS O-acetylase OafA/YrhL